MGWPNTAAEILTRKELDLIRQWFNHVQDTNPQYLSEDDVMLAEKIKAAMVSTHDAIRLQLLYEVSEAARELFRNINENGNTYGWQRLGKALQNLDAQKSEPEVVG